MHMDNDQMRAMYNSFGTLNRPQSYGDDLYNDRENITPAQPMTQTGEDEVGNPIMAPVEMPEASNKPILNNVIDVVSDAVTTPGAFSGQVGPIGTMTDTVANYIMGNDEQRQQILDRMQRYTPQGIESGIKSVIHSMSNATELEHTKLYENYFYNAEKKNAEIKRIANLLQIDENAFAHDRELYQKAALAADRVERMGKFKKYQDAEGNIDMAKIYADVPGLAEVQQKQGTAAAALALGNIDGIQSINEVYDNAFSRFAGSVYAGARRGYIADRRSAIWNAARKENRLPTAEEQAKLDEYDAELRTLPKYNYNTVGNVAGAMIGGAAENLAMIVKSQGAGAVAGVVAGRVGGAKAAEIARNAVSTYMMAQDIAGSQYEELVNKTDANGRPMYTPEQASWLALSQGVGEAVLEQYSLNQMGKAIFGRSAAKSLTEIIRTSPTIEAAKAGVRDYAALKISEAGKAGLISLGSEAFEEFTQQASDMLMENMAQVMLKGKDADITSVEDILAASTGQMVEALPAIGGFGLIGFGANPIANTRAVLGFRSNVRNVVNNKVLIGRMANAHYGEVLDGVWKNKGNIKELQDKAPESVTTILDTQNRLAGMEDGFVDVRELSKENADLVDKIAEANNISKDELAACLDGSGMLQVKTSTLMQMDLKDEQHKAIRDNVTTSLEAFTVAQENNAIKLVKEQMDSLQAFNDKTYKQAVENIISARFPDAEQAKLAREIIEANYDNPHEEFKRRLDAVNAEMDEYIAPVLDELRSGMKQGVDIIRMEGDRDAKYVKQSNNADWYRNYYADYGRAPNAEELRGLAIDIASGRQNARYGLMDYQNNTDETREYFGNVADTLDRLEEQREALMAIQDRMRDLNPGEMVATASLSKEGLKVYDTMRQMMGESENKDVRKAGAFNALFLARYADNMAKAISKARNIPYTAEDFVRDRFRINVNAEYNEEQMAAQMFQVSPAEFERQKAEVRSRYEGTDQWLKAPNGKDTNLTEEQWVTVRTDAFKNWFGDWEGNPAEASKIVDKNGEPKPIYHGTKMAEFNEFRSGNIFMVDDKKVADWYAGTENVVDKRTLTTDTDIAKKPIDEVIRYVAENQGVEWAKVQDSDLVVAMRRDFEYGFKKRNVARAEEKIKAEKERTDLTDAERKILDIAEKNLKLIQNFANGKGTANDVKKSIKYNKQAFDVRDGVENISERFELRRYINSLGLNELSSNMYKEGEKWLRTDARWVHYTEEDIRDEARRILRNNAERGVYPLFANIRNPLVLNANGAGWNGLHLEKISGNPKDVSVTTDRVADYAKENGYDGAVIQNVNDMSVVDYNPADDIVAFDSTQVKDATGRNVGFDPESGNIYLQTENASRNRVDAEITDEVYGAYSGQVNARMSVRQDGKEVAYVDYTLYDNKVHVNMVEADKSVRGKGYVWELMYRLQEMTPGVPIKFGMTTKDGTELVKAITETTKNENVIKTQAKIKRYEKELKALEDAADNDDGMSEKDGKRWDKLYYTLIPKLKKSIEGMSAGTTLVKEPPKRIAFNNDLFQQGSTAKGAISLTQQGQKIISLFESADQSTFVHEMAHMFLLDLQEIAGIDRESQQAKDLDTIMKWAEYKPGQADEYKGTASAEEFRKRDAAIKEAEAKGDTAEARRLKDVWAQERFARAFEEYLKSGEAPAQGLKRAFRAFKKWLVQIYNDVLGAGVRATPEVEAVMARMVASEEEIDAMEAANAIARIRKVDADILSTDAQEMIQRWQTEAKEQAKEKMLKELMKEYEQNNLKDIDKRLEQFKESAREELQNVPCFVCEQLIKDGTDMASALEITGFANQDEYTVALMQNGGSLENALNKMTEQAKANMLTEMPSKDKLYSMAEEALLSGDYNTRLAELEAQLLKRRQARYDNIPTRLRNAFSEMDEAIKEFEAAKVKEAVKKLKYAERWDAKNFETIKELESYLAKMERQEEDRAKLIEKFNKRYNELKEVTVRNTKWLQGVRDATLGHARVLQAAAVFRLAEESVSVATNARYWHRQALREAKRAWDNISGAQRTGREANFNAAVDAKQQQAVLDAMTAQAIKNKKQVDKWLNGARDGFKARAKRMADPKVKANVDMRYFHNHLLYVFGLRNSDAIPPTNYKSFQDLLAELRASHQFEDEVPAWLVSAAEASDQGKNYQQLTMGELEELYKLTRILYRLGLNDKGLLTMDVDMDTVVAECTADWMANTDYEVGNQRINEVKGAIGSYMNGLLKPEVLLSLLGGEQGGFVKYIYRILFNAAEAEEKAREKEAKVQRELYSKYYTKEELRAMVNDSVMIEGPDGNKVKLSIGEDTDITKENLICMALNWGNEANKARLLVGLFDCKNETELLNRENELKTILQAQLTKKDWEFVQAMWNHIGEFADPVSEVMEKSVGVPLDRVKAQAFDVEVDGEVIRLPGGYYPIVKDSSKSVRQTEFEQMEEAKAIGGVSVFGTGMSATKERAKNMFLNQGPLKLTLDVANNHITAQIHLINAKMAVRDAYKVINNKQIQDMVRRTCGEETVKTMNDWVLNCWAPPIRPRSWYENIAASLRSKTVGAIMGYRVSTALLNAANVVYMAQEIGTKNTLAAIVDFYRHPIQNREMILDISVYMRNRATNMDRDLQAQNEQILKRHTKVGNAIDKATGGKSEDLRYQMDKYANWLIEQTDMMVSMPMYMWQFKQTYSEEIAKGVPEEEARETANYEAVRRMTKVFPSSRAVDSSAIQRTKSEMTKLITPFFSFANTMMNAVWSKYYAGKFKGSERVEMLDDNGQPMLDEDGEPKYTTVKKSFVKRYGRFARAILFNFVLGAMVETLLRQVPDALAGTGDDDDDKFYSDLRKNVLSSAAAGFPGVNEGVNFLYSTFFEKPSYMGGRGVGVLSGTVQRYSKVVTDIAKITQGKDSIDAIDLFRDVARASNTKTGISDTLTDAIFNTARFIGDDYKFDDMADLREYIAKTIFDRKLKKK